MLNSDLIGKTKIVDFDQYETGNHKITLEFDGDEGETIGTLNDDISLLPEEGAEAVAFFPDEGNVAAAVAPNEE